MVDSSQDPGLVSLPLSQYGHKVFSSVKNTKSGKNEDEKSFNRYVRQLVDQYLNKEVVISKQPEDKVELIVQSCREKFPEFAHWTTTRIRIYIESCRRLKKIKNSPILLAKRKAAGRRFREGQKLKRIISSQFSLHAAESNRQLAEYILRANDNMNDVPMHGIEEPDVKAEFEEKEHSAFKNVYNGLEQDASRKLNLDTFNGVSMKPVQFMNNPALTNIMQLAPQLLKLDQPLFDQQNIPVMTSAATPTILPIMTSQTSLMTSSPLITPQPFQQQYLLKTSSPSMLTTNSPTMLTVSSPTMLAASSVTPQPIIAPQPIFSSQPRVVSPKTPVSMTTAVSPSLLSYTTRSITPTSDNGTLKMSEFSSPLNISLETPPPSTTSQHSPPATSSPSPPAVTPQTYISPKQKSFQIDALINNTRCQDNQINNTRPTINVNKTNILDRPFFPTGGMTFSEIINAKTLVTSYREAANFLYRAATELEQLLPSNTVF